MNKVLRGYQKDLQYTKDQISKLVDLNTKNAMKVQDITDLILKYGEKLPTEFLKEFIEITKN